MNNKIATIGSITIDLFVQPEKTKIISSFSEYGKEEYLALPHGGKICAEHIQNHLGGGATNTAAAFEKLGFKTQVFGGIGDDDNSEIIIKKLVKKNIGIRNIQRSPNIKSGFSLILNSFDGERTVIYTSEANKKFDNLTLKSLETENFDAVHLCHTSSEYAQKIFFTLEDFLRRNPNKVFSWNPGKESIEKGIKGNISLLKHTDFLYLNCEESEEFTGFRAFSKISHGEERRKKFITSLSENTLPEYVRDVSHIAKKFLEIGVKNIVITDGRRGAQVFSKKESFFIACASGSRVDTLGAGDGFASTFTALMLQGNSLQKSAQYASMMAANVVAYRGAQDGLLSLEDLINTSTDTIDIIHF